MVQLLVDFTGKKVDTIQKMFELQFDEAAWRQPSLLVFDNLDHIAGSPAGPEFEMTAEALYATRVAEGMFWLFAYVMLFTDRSVCFDIALFCRPSSLTQF